jgi:hypothetical protein
VKKKIKVPLMKNVKGGKGKLKYHTAWPRFQLPRDGQVFGGRARKKDAPAAGH